MRYALIDWDNTIHRGYTIYGLADYLLMQGFVSPALLHTFKELEVNYQAGTLSYAAYTERTCASFAQELAGRQAADYRSAVQDFLPLDEQAIFADAYPLFDLLNKHDIEVYLISGAPFDVLSLYKERFPIRGVFGFELEVREQILTGSVACNYGVDKDRILRHPRFQTPNAVHFLSMGDAVADIPLLNNSRIPIVVGGQRLALREGADALRFNGDQPWDLRGLEERLLAGTNS